MNFQFSRGYLMLSLDLTLSAAIWSGLDPVEMMIKSLDALCSDLVWSRCGKEDDKKPRRSVQ